MYRWLWPKDVLRAVAEFYVFASVVTCEINPYFLCSSSYWYKVTVPLLIIDEDSDGCALHSASSATTTTVRTCTRRASTSGR